MIKYEHQTAGACHSWTSPLKLKKKKPSALDSCGGSPFYSLISKSVIVEYFERLRPSVLLVVVRKAGPPRIIASLGVFQISCDEVSRPTYKRTVPSR